jgi:hypothetical protein
LRYLYRCGCGEFETETPADSATCLQCGGQAKRVWAVTLNTASARPVERYYDPQVGAVVSSQRESDELLKQGIEKQSAELNMDVKVAQVDARDTEALAELHGHGVDHRLAEKENTARAVHDERAKANGESKAKVKVPA